jgi:hypothetical protein|tara:strand:- start:962 stop:1216 length:255 start_codon:yes stop_codon:yes gene_type:complete
MPDETTENIETTGEQKVDLNYVNSVINSLQTRVNSLTAENIKLEAESNVMKNQLVALVKQSQSSGEEDASLEVSEELLTESEET